MDTLDIKTQLNIAPMLSEEVKRQLVDNVIYNYDQDECSRSEWMSKIGEMLQLFVGYRKTKNFPWDKCSNIHIPLMGIACLQFQSRAYDALIPQGEVVRAISTDGQTKDVADRVSRYLNYQLTEQMEEWEEDTDAMLLALPIFGSAVKKTYFDKVLGRPVSRLLSPDEFVASYRTRRLEDCERRTHIEYPTVNDVKIRFKYGIYTGDLDKVSVGYRKDSSLYSYAVDGITRQVEPSVVTNGEGYRKIIEQDCLYDLDGDGIGEPYLVTVDYWARELLSVQKNSYVDFLEKVEKRFNYYTAFTFIPNPESWMGLGFWHFLGMINEGANTIINQLIDAGTLANLGGKSGLISKRSGLKKTDVEISLGKFSEVDIPTEDIKKAIYTYEFREPSQALFNLLGLLKNYAQEVSSVSDSLLGKMPPSDTTATTVLAILEQGMKVFSTIHKRLHRATKKEFKKIFLLNSLYLDEVVYGYVQDSRSKEIRTLQSGRSDFQNNIDVIPTASKVILTKVEKLITAKTIYEVGMSNPLIQQNPQSVEIITKNYLKALDSEDVDDIVKIPSPPPPLDLPPQEEHALFIREQRVEPLRDQNHALHLQAHLIFSDSIWGKELTPQGRKLLDEHIQQTKAFAYLAYEKAVAETDKALNNIIDMGEMYANNRGTEGMVNIGADQISSPQFGQTSEFNAGGFSEGGNLGSIFNQ